MNIEDIWKIEDINDFIIALNDYISNKCQYGDDVSVLSEPERIFFITQSLEMEINNGGFLQFFYNSSGDFSSELVYAFTTIEANKTVEICKKALAAFGREIPNDRTKRREMLDEMESDEIDELLESCDNAFYEYDLDSFNYAYILKNKASFA